MEDHHADRNVEQRLLRVTDGRAIRLSVRHIVIINGEHAWLTAGDDRRWIYRDRGVIRNDEMRDAVYRRIFLNRDASLDLRT